MIIVDGSYQERSKADVHLDNILNVASNALINQYPPHGKGFNLCSRDISNCLHDYPSAYTGFASMRSLATKYYYHVVCSNPRKFQFTKDHVWPRQYAGDQIILSVYQYGVPIRAVIRSLVEKYTQVTYVTAEENKHLTKFQKSKHFEHPDVAYRLAGVITVLWPQGTRISKLPELYPELAISDLSSINSIG